MRPVSAASELLEWRVIVQLPPLDDCWASNPAPGLLSHDCEASVAIPLTNRLNAWLGAG